MVNFFEIIYASKQTKKHDGYQRSGCVGCQRSPEDHETRTFRLSCGQQFIQLSLQLPQLTRENIFLMVALFPEWDIILILVHECKLSSHVEGS